MTLVMCIAVPIITIIEIVLKTIAWLFGRPSRSILRGIKVAMSGVMRFISPPFRWYFGGDHSRFDDTVDYLRPTGRVLWTIGKLAAAVGIGIGVILVLRHLFLTYPLLTLLRWALIAAIVLGLAIKCLVALDKYEARRREARRRARFYQPPVTTDPKPTSGLALLWEYLWGLEKKYLCPELVIIEDLPPNDSVSGDQVIA